MSAPSVAVMVDYKLHVQYIATCIILNLQKTFNCAICTGFCPTSVRLSKKIERVHFTGEPSSPILPLCSPANDYNQYHGLRPRLQITFKTRLLAF